nr:MAG TPA: hypothetical protein [Caudoviricetes sp.]
MKLKILRIRFRGFQRKLVQQFRKSKKRFKCSEDQATKIVSLGLNAMFIEVLHHKLGKLAIDDLTVFNEVTNGR